MVRPLSQALRTIVYDALTSPPLTYLSDNGTTYDTVTLPATSVVPRAIWINSTTPPPKPYVCFAIAGSGAITRHSPDRKFTLTCWIVGSTEPECTQIFEAIYAKLHTADQESTATDLSLAASSSTLGAAIRECVGGAQYSPDYSQTIDRWLLVCEFRIVAA